MQRITFLPALMVWAFLAGCSAKRESANDTAHAEPAAPPLFQRLSAEESGIAFSNLIRENEQINLIDYFYLYNGGGVAIGDVNNDSLPDIYLTGNQSSSRLYLNKGNLKFEDVTQASATGTQGWCAGVTMVDINHDGWLDLYVCRAGNAEPAQRTNLLWVNNGRNDQGVPTFTEQAAAYGLNFTGYSTQSAFFDYDKDGDLDMYLLTHTPEIRNPNSIVPIKRDGSGATNDRLYRNDGTAAKPRFTDVTKQAGVVYEGLGLGVGINDLNGDGWEDIYVSNDFLASDHVYLNNHNGTFSEKGGELLRHQSNFAMGNDLADFNNDGFTDIVTADMLPGDNEQRKKMAGPMKYEQFQMALKAGYQPQFMRNMLQLNNGRNAEGKVTFSEIGQLAGIYATDWSWATLFADFDNDGLKDLLITNGYRRDITDLDFVAYNASLSGQMDARQADNIIKEKARDLPGLKKPNFVFRNRGDLTFENKSSEWGIGVPSYSNGAAYGDLDRDGDLDLVINTIDEPALVYRNTAAQTPANQFLSIHLQGPSGNPLGLGADVRVYTAAGMQLYHQAVTRGYQSSVDGGMVVGLGKASKVDSLEITWPDGRVQQLKDVIAGKRLVLDYKRAVPAKKSPPTADKPLLAEISKHCNVNFIHREDEYNDFSREFLLPHRHSRLGPGLAVGDMNGDGLDDFYVSGPFNQSGELFFQANNGRFRSVPLTKGQKYTEETGCLLFDADHDGDLDLYIANGGNEFGPGSEYFQDQLYRNDGKGNFTLATDALPPMRTSSSCVTAADYDADGDLDLFVGGRVNPLQYPTPGTSYLLQNQGGTFRDVTGQAAPGLRNMGMVTTSLWTDFDGDGRVDLLVAGEFMPIRFYRNTGGTFTDVSQSTGLTNTIGWWNSLNGADFDEDGDLDYVAGNLGLNTRYKASPDQPVSVYAGDFDGNGRWEPLLTYYLGGQEYPVPSRDDILNQLPSLRKKFVTYSHYANARLTDIIPAEALSSALVVRATHLQSVYLENRGGGAFQVKNLPLPAQIAPVFGTLCQDIDGDSHPDMLLTGNSYATEVVTGQYDASVGLLLKGDGKGNFTPVTHRQSGFFVDGDAKALSMLALQNGSWVVLAAQNNGSLKMYASTGNPSGKILRLQPGDARVEMTLKNGHKQKAECYYGASYLSQSSRSLVIPAGVTSVTLYDFAGKSRVVKP